MNVNQIMNDSAQAAFWSKVDIKDAIIDCWEWSGAKKPKGYGNVRVNKKYLLAHRVAFELATGIEIPKGLMACHMCDNPSCCNPSHLMLGTLKSNTYDMLIKGRQGFHKNKAIGERNNQCKLNPEKIIKIRHLHFEEGYTLKKISGIFGVSPTSIGAIINNKTWRHV